MHCKVCEDCFKSFRKFPSDQDNVHHRNYSSLLASAREGCALCISLMERSQSLTTPYPEPITFWRLKPYSEKDPRGLISVRSSEPVDFANPWKPKKTFMVSSATKNCPLTSGCLDCEGGKGFCYGTHPRVADNTGSPETWSQVMKWLGDCKREHGSDCNAAHSESWVPTRLLNVDEAGKIRLQTTFPWRPVRYVTLSHRWGEPDGQQFQLSESTLKLLQGGIDTSKLSQKFQDAVEIARRLNVSFIWIDSLCIIQGDAEDWRRESAQMGKIYNNGLLNISAGSDDTNKGLFQARDPSRIQSLLVDNRDYQDTELKVLHPMGVWYLNVECSPINLRCWVVQEKILSARVLHFSNDQVFWECHKLRACESLPDGIEPHVWTMGALEVVPLKTLVPGKPLGCYQDAALMAEQYWFTLVEYYSQSRLTFLTDMLVALSGLAREVHKMVKTPYVAGLWQSQLLRGLLWTPFLRLKYAPCNDYVAPSWSWASARRLVRFLDGRLSRRFHYLHPCCTIIGAQVTLVNKDDPYGQISGGWVHIRGRLCLMQWGQRHDYAPYRWAGRLLAIDPRSLNPLSELADTVETSGISVYVTLDNSENEREKAGHAVFLPMRLYDREAPKELISGLLVSRLPCGNFVRIGIASVYDKHMSYIEAFAEQEITII
ncbi:heterokaryon incompatibility protein-domain-containing protein [Phaeosphaeria sp. MPI-PUGE-AT-0046c]|nr:heterokaryon incompatibility protein-domain-containing protein [Phaeosphaeria sp. MPI-PUGE-AT-0046c]